MNRYRVTRLVTILIAAIIITANGGVSARVHRAAADVKHKAVFYETRRGAGKAKHRHRLVVDKNPGTENAQQHKPLDLAVPFKVPQDADAKRPINGLQEKTDSSLFENRNKQAAVQVKGQFVMSQDPEADKKKSADGAGLTINLRR
jgi:hypothetical protein